MKLAWKSRTRTAGPWRLKLERTEITAEEAHLGLRGTAVFELGPAVTEDCRLSLRRIAMGRKKVRREREREKKLLPVLWILLAYQLGCLRNTSMINVRRAPMKPFLQ